MAFLVAVVSRKVGESRGSGDVLVLALAILLPLGILMVGMARSGRWATVDASAKEDRPLLYRVTFLLLGLLAAWLAFSGRNGVLLHGILEVFALLLLGVALSPFLKTSLHLAFATYAAVTLVSVWPLAGYALLSLTPVLAWSRLALTRHTRAEVLVGALLGAAVAFGATLFR